MDPRRRIRGLSRRAGATCVQTAFVDLLEAKFGWPSWMALDIREQAAYDIGSCSGVPASRTRTLRLAWQTGSVDGHVIPPAEQFAVSMSGDKDCQRRAESARDTAALDEILTVLRAACGVDFSEYKLAPFERRVARRMAFQGAVALPDYLALLLQDPNEVRALYDDLLVSVTSFFRDPAVFDAMASETVPAILTGKHAKRPLRVWVAGCATGEEVYSLAILLLESRGGDPRHIQVIGTDVSHGAVAKARLGAYSDATLATVSPDRRERFFVRSPGGRRVNDAVHDLCSFFQHDLARDPPIAHVDLVSCRNVVMYFDQRLRDRVLERFHYALEQPGFLLLGRAEGVAGSGHLFSSGNGKSGVFTRNATASALRFCGDLELRSDAGSTADRQRPEVARPPGLGRYLDRLLLTRYAPAGVLINEEMQILEFRGQTGAYLELAPGDPSDDIMLMVREGLRTPLLTAIARSKDQMAPVRMRGVRVDRDATTSICDVVVSPLFDVPRANGRLFTVMFEAPRRRIASKRAVERENGATRGNRRALVEEHDTAVRLLRSANFELMSRNAELQRVNDNLRERLAAVSGDRDDV